MCVGVSVGWVWMNVLCYYLRLTIPQKALNDIPYSSLYYFLFLNHRCGLKGHGMLGTLNHFYIKFSAAYDNIILLKMLLKRLSLF